MAQLSFASDALKKFEDTPLSQPLERSLKQKRRYLDIAVNAFDKVMAYQVAEFTTVANYKLGRIYQTLATDLMNSQRPKNLSELELEQYELLLEEQAYPFEEKAIEIHQANSQRSWQGLYDQWVKASFIALRELSPGRFNKVEQFEEVAVYE